MTRPDHVNLLLRSPLTRARVNAELLDDSTERSALLRDLGEGMLLWVGFQL